MVMHHRTEREAYIIEVMGDGFQHVKVTSSSTAVTRIYAEIVAPPALLLIFIMITTCNDKPFPFKKN